MRVNRKNKLKKMKFKFRIFLILFIITIIVLLIVRLGVKKNFFENEPILKVHTSEEKVEKEIVIPDDVLKSKDKYVQDLIKESKSNEYAKIILSNLSEYPKRLVELAAEKPETIKFVSDYPKNKDENTQDIDIDKDYKKGEIPHFLQWDERWGYSKYGNQFIAINGCGPSSIAMVAVYLTGNTKINPKVVADYAYKNGYLVEGVGSKWSLMTKGAEHFGIKGIEIPNSKSVIKKELLSGHPIIAIMKKGHFTKSGHYLVLSGVTSDGKIKVKDSDSTIRTEKSWDISIIQDESENFWAYKKI